MIPNKVIYNNKFEIYSKASADQYILLTACNSILVFYTSKMSTGPGITDLTCQREVCPGKSYSPATFDKYKLNSQ